MRWKNGSAGYGSPLISLHWLMLLLIVIVYACIELRVLYPRGSEIREALKTWHFMLGLAVFVMVWLRLAVRLLGPAPPIVPAPPRWQLRVAHFSELAIYAFMIAMPLLGWLILSAENAAVPFFGVRLPALIGENEELAKQLEEAHEIIGDVGYFLIGIHAAAALAHHYIQRDNTLIRMLPWRVKNLFLVIALSAALLAPQAGFAHCDALDGPVVTLAKQALETGDVTLVLPWVPGTDEPEIRRAFAQTLSVRKLGPEARQLADTFFFETLVRVHRASEGAPYTGLKPAGLDLGPAIPAADKALISGSTAALEKLLGERLREGLRDHFEAARSRMKFDPADVAAGREYVQAYVAYVHYVEALFEAATKTAHGHYVESPGS